MLRAEPIEGARMLDALFDEVLRLVEETMPDIDTAPMRARLDQQRPVWNNPPDGVVV